MIVNVGMWLERFVIIVTSACTATSCPSSWGMYYADDLGLVDVHRHDRPVPRAAVPVHPLPADDLDLRDARRRWCPRRGGALMAIGRSPRSTA
jgi:hypothetical protein